MKSKSVYKFSIVGSILSSYLTLQKVSNYTFRKRHVLLRWILPRMLSDSSSNTISLYLYLLIYGYVHYAVCYVFLKTNSIFQRNNLVCRVFLAILKRQTSLAANFVFEIILLNSLHNSFFNFYCNANIEKVKFLLSVEQHKLLN